MVWMYLVSLFGFSFAILSMAEMASMSVAAGSTDFLSYADFSRAPTSGGQYRCVLCQDRRSATLTASQYVESSSSFENISMRKHVSQLNIPLTAPTRQTGYQSSRHRAHRNSCLTSTAGSVC